MNLKELYQKWIDGNDMDFLFRSFRLAITQHANGSNENEVKELNGLYNEIVDLYYNMKNNQFDKNEYNRKLEKLLLPVESFIQAKIAEQKSEYKEVGDQLG